MKGARGELEFAERLREHGYDARRHGRHFHGLEQHEHQDVTHNCGNLHFEVKRQERVDVWSWYDQAVQGAKEGEVPVVAFRKNRRPWFILLTADDFFKLIKENDEGT